jgi:myosin heavy subunit
MFVPHASEAALSRGKSKPADVTVLPRSSDECNEGHSSRSSGSDTIGVSNMDDLVYLHAASVLNNVKRRFDADEVYTYTGPILIAVNPFKPLSIYTQDVMERYHLEGEVAASELEKAEKSEPAHTLRPLVNVTPDMPPHCFAIAVRFVNWVANLRQLAMQATPSLQESAYRTLALRKTNVSVVICGESGAGKTETTKLLLLYLSRVASVSECALPRTMHEPLCGFHVCVVWFG